tara:strand:+ start:6229 stop:6366 length:138 start_codon:yes stop_codon:yes gene_type:complete
MASDILLDPAVTEITVQAEPLRNFMLQLLSDIKDLEDRVTLLETP